MTSIFSVAGAAMALALVLAAPADAQLLRGGLGGGLGLPAISGDLGISGTLGGVVNAPAVQAPVVQAPVVQAPAAPAVNTVVAVPAITNVEVRRAAIVNAGIVPIPYAQVPYYVDDEYVVLQDDLRGTGVVVEKQGQQIVLEMPSDVTFAFNKYDIQPRFYGVLDAVSRTLAKYPASYVDVYGHTDAIGSYAYNEVLSEKRADSVADYLAANHVNPARMYVRGFGKTEPVASNATIEGRAANRRVEIVLTPYAS